MPDRDVAAFDRRAGRYDRSWPERAWHASVHAALLRAVAGSAPAAILEVGCGTAALLRRAGARWPGARLAGIDPAPAMVAEAARRCPGCDIRHGWAEELPWADGSFDLVLTSLSLHHWRDPAAGLRQAARVLHAGGAVGILDMVSDGPAGAVLHALVREPFLSSRALSGLLQAAGLGDVRVRRLGPGLGQAIGILTGRKGS